MCSGPWSESSKQGRVPECRKLNSNAKLNWLCSWRAKRLSLDSQTSQLYSRKPCHHQTRRWQYCFGRATEDWGLGHPWKLTVLCMYWPIRKTLGKLIPAGSHYFWRHVAPAFLPCVSGYFPKNIHSRRVSKCRLSHWFQSSQFWFFFSQHICAVED